MGITAFNVQDGRGNVVKLEVNRVKADLTLTLTNRWGQSVTLTTSKAYNLGEAFVNGFEENKLHQGYLEVSTQSAIGGGSWLTMSYAGTRITALLSDDLVSYLRQEYLY